MRILITGGTGFLGTELAEELVRRGHDLLVATRNPRVYPHSMLSFPARCVKWPLDPKEIAPYLSSLDACIHLAGEPLATKKWSTQQKKRIYESRVMGTRQLVAQLSKAGNLKVLLSGSAVGFYGDCGNQPVYETHSSGDDFLAEVCSDWEDEAKALERPSVRTVLLRSGVVLGRSQGFLAELEPLHRLGLAGPLGSGEQCISWIHLKDWVRAVVFALEHNSVNGPINLTAPEPITNRAFTRELGKVFQQRVFPPVPAFAVRLVMGELAQLALTGQKVFPQKLESYGFRFLYTHLTDALKELYGEARKAPAHYLVSRQWINASIEKVFDQVTNGANLPALTPKKFKLEWIGKSTENLQKGSCLDWRLNWVGFTIYWRSQILKWQPTTEVQSHQMKGPFRHFTHTMRFERIRDGVLLKDVLEYDLPLGSIADLAAGKKVQKDLSGVFFFRGKKLAEYFSKEHPSNPSGEREGSRSS